MKRKLFLTALFAVMTMTQVNAAEAKCTVSNNSTVTYKYYSGNGSNVNCISLTGGNSAFQYLNNQKYNVVCKPVNNCTQVTTAAQNVTEATTEATTAAQNVTQATTAAQNVTQATTAAQNVTQVTTVSQSVTEATTEATTAAQNVTEATTAKNDTSKTMEQQVVELVNAERAKYGLAALTIDSAVSNVAQIKSEDMRDNNYFSHTSPTYGSPFDMMKTFGVKYTSAGENIAKGQKTAQAVVDAWMNSEGHRANILSSSFTKIGVGYAVGNGSTYWTQMFIR